VRGLAVAESRGVVHRKWRDSAKSFRGCDFDRRRSDRAPRDRETA